MGNTEEPNPKFLIVLTALTVILFTFFVIIKLDRELKWATYGTVQGDAGYFRQAVHNVAFGNPYECALSIRAQMQAVSFRNRGNILLEHAFFTSPFLYAPFYRFFPGPRTLYMVNVFFCIPLGMFLLWQIGTAFDISFLARSAAIALTLTMPILNTNGYSFVSYHAYIEAMTFPFTLLYLLTHLKRDDSKVWLWMHILTFFVLLGIKEDAMLFLGLLTLALAFFRKSRIDTFLGIIAFSVYFAYKKLFIPWAWGKYVVFPVNPSDEFSTRIFHEILTLDLGKLTQRFGLILEYTKNLVLFPVFMLLFHRFWQVPIRYLNYQIPLFVSMIVPFSVFILIDEGPRHLTSFTALLSILILLSLRDVKTLGRLFPAILLIFAVFLNAIQLEKLKNSALFIPNKKSKIILSVEKIEPLLSPEKKLAVYGGNSRYLYLLAGRRNTFHAIHRDSCDLALLFKSEDQEISRKDLSKKFAIIYEDYFLELWEKSNTIALP